MSSPGAAVSRAVLGRRLRSDRLDETLLPKRLALPVFCSDPLSSVAYATEQILIVLGLGGLAMLDLTPWVAVGGGRAAGDRRRLLSPDLRRVPERRRRLRGQPRQPGRERIADRRRGAADRLRADSGRLGRRRRGRDHQRGPAAGAVTRSGCRLASWSSSRCVNLRGVKESGRVFAIPTYGFVACVFALLAVGVARLAFGDGLSAESADYGIRNATRDRRACRRLPGPAGVRLRLHRPDRGRGRLQRGARRSSRRRAATRRRR